MSHFETADCVFMAWSLLLESVMSKAVFIFLLSFLSLPLLAWAAPSPNASNPIFQALLATLLEVEPRSEEQSLQRLDQFFASLQKTFNSATPLVEIPDFETYLKLRNPQFPNSEDAFRSFIHHGVVTPLNIRASSSELMERIILFEMREAKALQNFASSQLPSRSTEMGLAVAAWNVLPDLLLMSVNLRNSLDQASAEAVQKSYSAAERWQKEKNPLGIFAWTLGTGLNAARSVGQTIVNPLTSQAVYGETIQRELRQKLALELAKIRAWPDSKKAELLRLFTSTVDSTLLNQAQQSIPDAGQFPSERLRKVVQVLRMDLIPSYLQNLSRRQKSKLIWSVLSDPNFFNKTSFQQMQIALNALGPVFPEFMRHLAKLPLLQGHDFAKAFCCSSGEVKSAWSTAELREKMAMLLRPLNVKLDQRDMRLLGASSLKETYQIQVETRQGPESWVVQILKPDAEKSVQDDVRLLQSLDSNSTLKRNLQDAGLPEWKPWIETCVGLAQESLDLGRAKQQTQMAAQFYQKSFTLAEKGRPLEVEIKVPPVIQLSRDVLLQEDVEGMTVEQARRIAPGPVQTALNQVAEMWLKESLSGSGFVWAEPNTRNIRVRLSDQSVQLHLMNWSSSETLTHEELKNFFSQLGRLPLRELRQLQKNPTPDLQQAENLIHRLAQSDVGMDPVKMKFALSFLHLQELVGREKFQSLLIKTVASRPWIVWSVLSEKIKQKLASVYGPVQSHFEKNQIQSKSATLRPAQVACQKVHLF